MITILEIQDKKVIDFAEVEYISFHEDKEALELFGLTLEDDKTMVIGMKSKRKIRVDKLFWDKVYDHFVEVNKFLYGGNEE